MMTAQPVATAFTDEEWRDGAHALMHALNLITTELPFASFHPVYGHNPWQVSDTGQEHVDMDRGRHYADLALSLARRHRNPLIIGVVLSALTRTGGGVTANGFLTRIASAAAAGSHH